MPDNKNKSSGKKWAWIIAGLLFLVIFVLPTINAIITAIGLTGQALYGITGGR